MLSGIKPTTTLAELISSLRGGDKSPSSAPSYNSSSSSVAPNTTSLGSQATLSRLSTALRHPRGVGSSGSNTAGGGAETTGGGESGQQLRRLAADALKSGSKVGSGGGCSARSSLMSRDNGVLLQGKDGLTRRRLESEMDEKSRSRMLGSKSIDDYEQSYYASSAGPNAYSGAYLLDPSLGISSGSRPRGASKQSAIAGEANLSQKNSKGSSAVSISQRSVGGAASDQKEGGRRRKDSESQKRSADFDSLFADVPTLSSEIRSSHFRADNDISDSNSITAHVPPHLPTPSPPFSAIPLERIEPNPPPSSPTNSALSLMKRLGRFSRTPKNSDSAPPASTPVSAQSRQNAAFPTSLTPVSQAASSKYGRFSPSPPPTTISPQGVRESFPPSPEQKAAPSRDPEDVFGYMSPVKSDLGSGARGRSNRRGSDSKTWAHGETSGATDIGVSFSEDKVKAKGSTTDPLLLPQPTNDAFLLSKKPMESNWMTSIRTSATASQLESKQGGDTSGPSASHSSTPSRLSAGSIKKGSIPKEVSSLHSGGDAAVTSINSFFADSTVDTSQEKVRSRDPHRVSIDANANAIAGGILGAVEGLPPPPRSPIKEIIDSRNNKFTIDDFDMRATVGTGTFGRVRMVKLSGCSDRTPLALKILKKSEVIRLKQVEHVQAEKEILKSIYHPFIVNLFAAFQDSKRLFMLMEFVNGGELFSHLRKEGRLPFESARFYSAEITLALDYLHRQNIVYRDLKPENLLIDSGGHIKITDFGFAKVVEDRTWTLCGTPEYLAPEVIQSRGHGKSVDWWGLGILIFEMLAGYPPFYDENPLGIYQKVLAGRIDFPRHIEVRAKDLIKRLLTHDRSRRYGCLKAGAEDIKRHRWFRSIDWNLCIRRKLEPPYIPEAKAPDDTSMYDKYPESTEANAPSIPDVAQDLFRDF